MRGRDALVTCYNDSDVVRARGGWRNELEEEQGGAGALQQVPASPALPCPALHELGWHQWRCAYDDAVHLAARHMCHTSRVTPSIKRL